MSSTPWFPKFFLPFFLPWDSLTSGGRNTIEVSSLVFLCSYCLVVSHCICSYQILEEAFLIMIRWASNYKKNQNIIRTQSIDFFFLNFGPLDCLPSGFWSSRHCQSWASFCGMGLKLDQSLVGYYHSSYTSTHLPGMTGSMSKFCGCTAVLVPPLEVAWLPKMTGYALVSCVTRSPKQQQPTE